MGSIGATNQNEKDGKVFNGKFYSNEELKKMSDKELLALMRGSNDFLSNDNDKYKGYSFENAKLDPIEKDMLVDAVDWVKGDTTLTPDIMQTIASYYGIKFGKSGSILVSADMMGNTPIYQVNSMNKALVNQLLNNLIKLRDAIKKKENI